MIAVNIRLSGQSWVVNDFLGKVNRRVNSVAALIELCNNSDLLVINQESLKKEHRALLKNII